MLLDSGASHNYAPAKLVQAMQLPVVAIQPAEVKLPNGNLIASRNACKLHVEFAPKVVRRVTFVVVDVELPFVLGMQWLRSSNVHAEFSTGRIQMRDKSGKIETELNATKKPQHLQLHSATLHALEAFASLQDRADVFACSAKQANRLLKQKDCKTMFAVAKCKL